jgi:hypothetical protein
MSIQIDLRRILGIFAVVTLHFIGGVSTSFAQGQITTKNHVWYSPGLNPTYEIEGTSSKVVRTHKGFSVQIRTKELYAGEAYTLLVAIFNYPENCTGGASYPWPDGLEPEPACSALDLLGPGVYADILHLTGNVIGESGLGAFAAYLEIGDIGSSILAPVLPTVSGLLNPQGAEYHFVLLSHGPKLPEFMPDMIKTYLGGCSNQPIAALPNLPIPAWGERGPNTCAFQQEVFDVAPAP